MWKKIKLFLKENYKFFIILFIVFGLFQFELPYKIYTPGGMVNLDGRITVENGYSSEGTFGMAYVSMVRGSIPFLLLSHVIPDWDIVSKSELTLDNETFEERFQADKIATQQSIDSAIISSFTLAGKDVTVNQEVVHITYLDKKAKTNLKLFDIVLSLDGVSIHSTSELRKIIESHQEGDQLAIKVLRDNKEIDCYAEVFLIDGVSKIGISMTITYEYDESPHASIETKASESGPSGGLMMALSLYNALVEEDITKGKKIIGTGTIDVDGIVGEIGGVRYKLIGAVQQKCDVFLVPQENYEEALQVKNEKGYTIQLLPVSTLKEAVEKLKELE